MSSLISKLSTNWQSPSIDEELIDILRLIRSQNIGVRTFKSLIKLYGSASLALHNVGRLSLKGGRHQPIEVCTREDALLEIEACSKFGAEMISYRSSFYPPLLATIEDAPPVLTIIGKKEILKRNLTIAIVGSRNASLNGCKFASKIASDLGKKKIAISSGLARGIDSAAHNASLESGTIAVVAGGIDQIYPAENKDLFWKITETGAIIAELPFGTVPRGQNFPQRNRIISGISHGVIVVEANFGSGSLITARMALEQNRELFAVPGFPFDPRSNGTNNLIKNGAKLIENANDVIEELQSIISHANYQIENNTNSYLNEVDVVEEYSENEIAAARKEILQKLSSTPINFDEIITEIALPASIGLIIMTELELAGRVTRYPGNRISLNYEI